MSGRIAYNQTSTKISISKSPQVVNLNSHTINEVYFSEYGVTDNIEKKIPYKLWHTTIDRRDESQLTDLENKPVQMGHNRPGRNMKIRWTVSTTGQAIRPKVKEAYNIY